MYFRLQGLPFLLILDGKDEMSAQDYYLTFIRHGMAPYPDPCEATAAPEVIEDE
jgi:hypothetical protein